MTTVLVIDTSTSRTSVALVAGDKVLFNEFIQLQSDSVGEYGDLIARLSRTSEPILIDQELAK